MADGGGSKRRAILEAGYRCRADRDIRIAEEMNGVSTEANFRLGEAPDW